MSAYPDRDDTGAACGGRATFHRFNTRNLCPHCDHEGPCIYFDNGDVLCHREGEPGNWTDSFIGGYWHRALGTTGHQPVPRRLPSPSTPPITPADLTLRNAVYADLLRLCPLSQDQRAAHQLTNAQAHRYGWLPSDPIGQARIVTALLDTYTREELRGVPGFREHNGHITIRGGDMMMLPTRDLDGKIHAIDLRREVVQPKQSRYIKLSSRIGRDGDAPSPGAPAHVALPAGGVTVDGVIGVTEGVKKADYAADALGYPVVSIPGVGSWRVAVDVLERFAGNVVVLMLDQDDPQKNEGATVAAVERARTAMATAAVSLGYAVRLATWEYMRAKGIDDLLAAGHLFVSERYRPAASALAVDDTAPIAGIAPATDGAPWVTVAPQLLAVLIEKAMATDTLRRKYQQQNLLITDKRLKPGDKVLTAAVWDMAMPEGRDPGPPAPRKIYRAALAERTGMSVSTISRKLQDASKMGLITYESRQTAADNTELWVGVGRLPDKALTAAQVNDLAQNRQKDRDRKLCPNCGGTRLKPVTYICTDCHQTCTDDEATTAGRETITMDSGAIVDAETGEILTPAPTRAESAPGHTTSRGDTPSSLDQAPATPRAESAHLSRASEELWCANEGAGQEHRAPIASLASLAATITSEADKFPTYADTRDTAPPPDDLRPCSGGCGGLTHRGWPCKACRERQDHAEAWL